MKCFSILIIFEKFRRVYKNTKKPEEKTEMYVNIFKYYNTNKWISISVDTQFPHGRKVGFSILVLVWRPIILIVLYGDHFVQLMQGGSQQVSEAHFPRETPGQFFPIESWGKLANVREGLRPRFPAVQAKAQVACVPSLVTVILLTIISCQEKIFFFYFLIL